MVKTAKTHLVIAFGIILLIVAGVFALGNATKMYVSTAPPFIGFGKFEKDYIDVPPQKPASDSVTYAGENGKDALTLLRQREKSSIEQDNQGMIIAINGRKADSSKHEYWAFYVNGKLADVGAADYKTKDEDKIEWKIEKY